MSNEKRDKPNRRLPLIKMLISFIAGIGVAILLLKFVFKI